MIRIALLRHGHTSWNREHRIQGRSDIPLDDAARADLAALSLPAPWDRADLWSSPLLRAKETAEIVAGRAPHLSDRLTEMNWGDWEGLHGADLLADPAVDYRHIEDWGWDYSPPGGEPPSALRDRLLEWCAGLERDAVAVCHIGVMRVLLALAHGWDFAGPAPFAVKRARLYPLIWEDGRLRPDPEVETVRLVPRGNAA
ncbi:histidine phosphatase family protein [Chachezhania sediminis]|uniref:histidine phosphatase family protein n=1 Tax=Chachezhania sediminis TaxID=2599291 RepID=UPI00131E3C00|nr:histidine phosphatase family protein [Chachezhania sediminis]